MATAMVLIALSLVAVFGSVTAPWPVDRLGVVLVFAFALTGGFAWGWAARQ